MSSAPEPEATAHPLLPGASPATIRSFLLPEDQPTFITAYEAALDDARRSLDLVPVLEVIEHWRCVAAVQSDPARFRTMVRRAAESLTGRPVPEDEPFAVTRTKAGLQALDVYDVDLVEVRPELPSEVLGALAEVRASLEVSPHTVGELWSPTNPTGMRVVTFAGGRAFLVFGVIEHERRVAVYGLVVL